MMDIIELIVILILLSIILYLSSIIKKNDKKSKIINYDNLTGLNNMYYLKNNFKYYLSQNSEVLLLLIDFKQLKFINDNHGHEIGDKCIIIFSDAIKKHFDSSLLIRRGGDEFVIVANDNMTHVKKMLYQVQEEINTYYNNNLIPISFGFNVGITKCKDESLLDKYLEEADVAMYEAKSNGQLLRIYDQKLHQKIKEEEALIKAIEDSLYNKEIYYEFQPSYKKDKKEILSVECLLRFKKGNKVYDEDTLSILKRSYLLEEIDLYTIEYIFNLISENNMLKKIFFTINLSPQTLLDINNNFIDNIKEKIKKYNIDIKKIGFELSENMAIENIEVVKAKLGILKELGFSIILDNFGSKYSSLIHLSEFPIDIIKVDKNLFRKSISNSKDKILLDSLLALAKKLNITIILSGIEDKKEVEYIDNLKDDIGISGYYYSKPLSLEELRKITFK